MKDNYCQTFHRNSVIFPDIQTSGPIFRTGEPPVAPHEFSTTEVRLEIQFISSVHTATPFQIKTGF